MARAERFLAELGLRQLCVHVHDNIARIEVPPEAMPVLLEENTARKIAEEFKALGYSYVTLDLLGYRMGSMNEELGKG